MFSYYGSKSKIIKKYPKPLCDKIIEPFCGSSRYALEYPEHDVLLVDRYKVIVDIWNYLINASVKDIEALPELERGDKIPEQLLQVEKDLLGFAVNRGSPTPKHTYTTWAARDKEITRHKKRIIKYLDKIRHWKVQLGSYEDIPNQKATWFIDPPYQKMGIRYEHKDIDYNHLANWCRERESQVIVCENLGADWLPFTELCSLRGQKKTSIEAIWTKTL